MKSKRALKEFEQHFRRAGDKQVPPVPRAGIERMVAFYGEVRADDVDLESDGDMLLFQWGTYDWGSGEMFEVDITRQLIRGAGEDDEIWQLHLTYRFAPSEPLRAIGKGNRWCARPDGVASFAEFIRAHPAITALGSRDDGQIRLEYECAG
jgi:hypothetical protein